MSERSILITGCSSGIGHYCAGALKEHGWRVFATARNPEDVARLETEGFEALHLDYADHSSITRCVEEISKRTDGKLTALFNNGAFSQPGAVEDLPVDALRVQFETNVLGWHELILQVLPIMRAQGRGRIVQNSSVLGLVAMKWRGAYVASKFAIEALSDTLRLELRGTDIHVITLEPGPIASRFSFNSAKNFRKNIDLENSVHKNSYAKHLKMLDAGGTTSRVKLEPKAVCDKLIWALESPWPKAHYYVTFPTHLLATFRRILPQRMLDRFLIFASGKE